MAVIVKEIDENGFRAMEKEWQCCLEQSNANALFMGWPWLYSWWEVWSSSLGLDLLLLGVYDENDQLVGIGPFYQRDLVTPLGFRVRRLHLIGNAWHIAPTVRTEYCGLILSKERAGEACSALMDTIAGWNWDEWVLCDVVEREVSLLEKYASNLRDRTVRVFRVLDEGVVINTSGEFGQWLAKLGRNTRLKAYNRRNYLSQRGNFELAKCDSSPAGNFLAQLNEFHLMRWGKPVFDKDAVRFHRLLMARLPACGGRVYCSELRFDGICVSVLYDVRIGGQRFNLQSGYLERFDKRVALGSLHLGFAIEDAFRDPETVWYDLLAGSGKHHYYKHHFKGSHVRFHTFQVVRNPLLRRVYRTQELLPVRWRRFINRWFKL